MQCHLAKVSILFSWQAALIWCLVIAFAVLMAAMHWQDLLAHHNVNAFSAYNLVIIALLYPIIKLLHELGYAFSARYYGCEVHEMDVTFLLFMPIPYVDVSTINFLCNKHQRF